MKFESIFDYNTSVEKELITDDSKTERMSNFSNQEYFTFDQSQLPSPFDLKKSIK